MLKQLQEVDLPREQKRLTDATAEGDLQENAEYEDAQNQVQVIEARIDEVKQLIKKLEAGEKTKQAKA